VDGIAIWAGNVGLIGRFRTWCEEATSSACGMDRAASRGRRALFKASPVVSEIGLLLSNSWPENYLLNMRSGPLSLYSSVWSNAAFVPRRSSCGRLLRGDAALFLLHCCPLPDGCRSKQQWLYSNDLAVLPIPQLVLLCSR
jgi:hypothetical protein